MNTDIVIYLTALFFLFLGWFPAYLTYRRKTIKLAAANRTDQAKWYHAGWEDAKNYEDQKKSMQARLDRRTLTFPHVR